MKTPRSSETAHWLDVSVSIHDGMVRRPRNPDVRIERVREMDRGDTCNLSVISMGSHSDTHMDAPAHFIRAGKGIDEIPLDVCMGPARVIEIDDTRSIGTGELVKSGIREGERVLFKTRNSPRCWETSSFIEDAVYLSTEGARLLAERRVRLVGVDYLSVGGFLERNGTEVHRALLEAGVWIIEGLDLSGVRAGLYELICLPLKIRQGDGAPARAVLRPIQHADGHL